MREMRSPVDIVEAIRQELKRNEAYLRQVGRYHALYQNRTYDRVYDLLSELQQRVAAVPPLPIEREGGGDA